MSERERRELQSLGRKLRLRAWLLALIPVLLGAAVLGAIIMAADGKLVAFVLMIAFGIGLFKSLAIASNAEKLSLLFRRTARVGSVERFERVRGPETEAWLREWVQNQPAEEDADDLERDFWRASERFEKALARSVGRNVEWFEAVGRDPVPVYVEGQRVPTVIDPSNVSRLRELKNARPEQDSRSS